MKIFKTISTYFGKNKKKPCKCNHNPYDVNSTLQEVNRKFMTSPDQKFFVCKECHQGLKFIKNEDGDFIEESVPC